MIECVNHGTGEASNTVSTWNLAFTRRKVCDLHQVEDVFTSTLGRDKIQLSHFQPLGISVFKLNECANIELTS